MVSRVRFVIFELGGGVSKIPAKINVKIF